MKLLVSSVTCQDRFPTPSAERSLNFVSSVFKPFSCGGNWPLLPHTAGLRQACRHSKAAWNCCLLHGLAFWLQTQVTGKARWPLSCAGLGHGKLALPLSWHACQGWNVHLHTEGDYASIGDLSSVAMSMSVSSRESLFSGSITQSVFVLLK